MKTKSHYLLALLFVFSFNFVYSQTYWTGSQNKKWDNWKNWNPQVVPDETTDVIIPGSLSKYPIINNKELSVNSAVGQYKCRSLVVEAGGLLSVGFEKSEIGKPKFNLVMKDILLLLGGSVLILALAAAVEVGILF